MRRNWYVPAPCSSLQESPCSSLRLPIERDAKNLLSFICEVVLGTVGIGRNHTRAIGVSWGLVPLSATS